MTWDGGALLIRSTVTVTREATKTLQTWRLEAGELVVEQTSDAGGRKETTRARYRKK